MGQCRSICVARRCTSLCVGAIVYSGTTDARASRYSVTLFLIGSHVPQWPSIHVLICRDDMLQNPAANFAPYAWEHTRRTDYAIFLSGARKDATAHLGYDGTPFSIDTTNLCKYYARFSGSPNTKTRAGSCEQRRGILMPAKRPVRCSHYWRLASKC